MADGTQKDIEDVKVGDQVLSFDENGSLNSHEVLELESPVREGYYEIHLQDTDKTVLKVTSEHPIYSRDSLNNEGWGSIDPAATLYSEGITVQKIAERDWVKREDGSWSQITAIKFVPQSVQTYNLKQVADSSTFFANDVYVHNKCTSKPGSCCGPDYNYNPPDKPNLFNPFKRVDGIAPNGQTQLYRDGQKCEQYGKNNKDVCKRYQQIPYYVLDTSPYGDVTLSWYITGPNTHTECTDRSDSGKCTEKTKFCDSAPNFGTRNGKWCAGTPGKVDLGGQWKVYVGSTRKSMSLVDPALVQKVRYGLKENANNCWKGQVTIPASQIALGQVNLWKVIAESDSSNAGSTSSDIWSFQVGSSCTATLSPSTVTLSPGETADLTATFTGTGDEVVFLSNNTNVATVTSPDTSSPYTSTVTAVSPGVIAVQAVVRDAGNPSCTTNPVQVTVSSPGWWQTQGGNVGAKNLLSALPPSGDKFILDFPGAAVFGGSSTGLDSGNVSSLGWLANSVTSNQSLSSTSYSSVKSRILNTVTPNAVTSNTLSHNDLASAPAAADGVSYLFHESTDALDISNPGGPINLGNQKVVLLTEGDVNIKNPIRFGAGGLFVLISKGNISIDPGIGAASDPSARTTPDLQGLYLSQGRISTGEVTDGKTLRWQGTVIGLGGIDLQRKVASGTSYPSEFFAFDPNLILSLPKALQNQVRIWSEVAP